MNKLLHRRERVDFEELGFQTMLQCGDDEERARDICGCRIHRYDRELQPEIGKLHTEIEEYRNRGTALHAHLYDRTVPVNDAAMLAHSKKWRMYVVLAIFAAVQASLPISRPSIFSDSTCFWFSLERSG